MACSLWSAKKFLSQKLWERNCGICEICTNCYWIDKSLQKATKILLIMMNCFWRMLVQWKCVKPYFWLQSLLDGAHHCKHWTYCEQDLNSSFVEWRCAVTITTWTWYHKEKTWKTMKAHNCWIIKSFTKIIWKCWGSWFV